MTPEYRSRAGLAPPVDARQAFARHAAALQAALGVPLADGCRIELLLDGPAACRAMSEAIDAARDHINIEGWTAEAGGAGQELAHRLAHKRRQGVKVNLLPEAACSGRLVIVDGRQAFAGGLDVGSAATHRGGPHKPWRDTYLRLEGPAVAQLQQRFLDRWIEQAGQRPYLAHFFPRPRPAGEVRAAVARQGRSFYTALLQAIGLAQERICVSAARFMPPRPLLQALECAAQRGVSVRLLLPGTADAWSALHAGRSHYGRLLQAGARIWERQRALLRAKAVVIDGLWASLGPHDLDRHSLLDGAGAHLVLLDARFGARLEAAFADDLQLNHEITPDQWRLRGPLQRLGEVAARALEGLS